MGLCPCMHCGHSRRNYIFSGKTVLLIKLHKNFSSSFSQGFHIHLAEGTFHQNFKNVQVITSKKGLTDTCEAWEKILNPSWLLPLFKSIRFIVTLPPFTLPCYQVKYLEVLI